jgi:hypothetical protein
MNGWCLVGGQCTQDYHLNPNNDCQICDSSNPTGWDDMPDGFGCNAIGSSCPGQCSGGACVGATTACTPDNLSCTYDDCDPADHQCYDTKPGFCKIVVNGAPTCIADGQANTQNPCESCDTSVSNSGWTAANGGAACDTDNNGCTEQACVGGSCVLVNIVTCPNTDGLSCTVEDCVSTGDTSYTCQSNLMGTYCLIGGQCYYMGETNLSNACQHCVPSVNQSGWTNKSNGTYCSSSSYCSEACYSGSCQQVPCQPDGLSCTYDNCLSGVYDCGDLKPNYCLIGGACKSNGTTHPTNDCLKCDSSQSTSGWSPGNQGATCMTDNNGCTEQSCNNGNCQANPGTPCMDDGLVCTETCTSTGTSSYLCNELKSGYCLIGGVCYSNGAQNPANPCQKCDSSANAQGWTASASGAQCDGDGDGCTVEECQGGACVQTLSIVCIDALECEDDTCVSTGAYTYVCPNPLLDGWCLINGTCYADGEDSTTNECVECKSGLDPNGWSPKDDCSTCGEGETPAGCPTAGFCIWGSCHHTFGHDEICNACYFPDPCNQTFGICVAELIDCGVDGQLVECGALHPNNPNLICGFFGQFFPNCN